MVLEWTGVDEEWSWFWNGQVLMMGVVMVLEWTGVDERWSWCWNGQVLMRGGHGVGMDRC